MSLSSHQQKQEAKYAIPYHYLQTEQSVAGVLYLSYLRRARRALLDRSPARALDCGCGDGRFVAFVREEAPGFLIEGTDYSDTALAFARIFNPGVPFTAGDLRGPLPFADASFDALSLIEVVEHFEPNVLPAVLHECRRILRPGGALIITTPTTGEKKISKAHFQHFTEESMRRYLQGAGFRLASIEGNYRSSVLQSLCQGLMENRLFAVRWRPLLRLYTRAFKERWDRCPLAAARRMIVAAEAI